MRRTHPRNDANAVTLSTHLSNAERFLRSPQGEYQIYLTNDLGGPATAALEIVGAALPLLGL